MKIIKQIREPFSFFYFAILMLGLGCSDDFDPAFRVIDNRILGAKLKIVDGEGRATAAPGDQIEVELLMANRGEALPLTWMMAVCIPVPTQFGVSVCASEPLHFQEQLEPDTQKPRLSWTVPPQQFLGDLEELLVLGAVCQGGVPEVNMEELSFSCGEANQKETLFTFTIPLVQEGVAPNNHPEVSFIRLGFEPWFSQVPSDFPEQGCNANNLRDLSLPFLIAGNGSLPIEVLPTDTSREEFEKQRFGQFETSFEALQIEYYCTTGELSGQYVVIDDMWDPSMSVIQWRAPSNQYIPEEGLLVRFYFVMRDGRGGVDFETRALCLVPPSSE